MVMKLRSYAAIILSSAVLVAQTPAMAQMDPKLKPDALKDAPVMMPQTEMPKGEMPKREMPKSDVEMVPATTPIAPVAAPEAMPEAMPKGEMSKPEKPSMPLPTLDSAPAKSMPAPSAMERPSGPVPAAMTQVLPQETITGIKTVSLPEPSPIQPAFFTLPIDLKVAQDTSVTSSTPISDRYTGKANWDLAAWTAGVRNCLQQKPKLLRVVGDQSVPFMLNGTEGTIMLNANNQAVCPM
jgi:hypothetical protein